MPESINYRLLHLKFCTSAKIYGTNYEEFCYITVFNLYIYIYICVLDRAGKEAEFSLISSLNAPVHKYYSLQRVAPTSYVHQLKFSSLLKNTPAL